RTLVIDCGELKYQPKGGRQRSLQPTNLCGGCARRGSVLTPWLLWRRFRRWTGFCRNAFEQDKGLVVQMLLESSVVLRITNVRYASQPDRWPVPASRDEFSHRDLELDNIGVAVGDTDVRLRWQIRRMARFMGGTAAEKNQQSSTR